MRLGIRMLAVLALLGCSSNDIPVPTGTTTSTTADVTGSWTLTWGPMTGTFTVHDTIQLIIDTTVDNTVVPPDTTIDTTAVTRNRLVADTCNASGTMTVTQQTPIANVNGTYTMTRTCINTLVFPDSALGDTVLSGVARVHSDTAYSAVVTGQNTFYLFLDNHLRAHDTLATPAATPLKQGQQALVSGNSMSGVAVWANIRFRHSPKDPRAQIVPLTGTFSATRP